MDLNQIVESLRGTIDANAASADPECITSEFSLGPNAWIPLVRPAIGPYAEGCALDIPPKFKTYARDQADGVDLVGRDTVTQSAPRASVESIIDIVDAKERQIVQRAASRGIVVHVESLDEYKYSFNNAWAAKDEDGLRFSYICQDSVQNKDRHANGFSRTVKNLKNTGVEGERGQRKPTFDCKGKVSVKFSAKTKSVVVQYRHSAVHAKAAERTSIPRAASENPSNQSSKRKRSDDTLELAMQSVSDTDDYHETSQSAREYSLFELLQRSAEEQAAKQDRKSQPGIETSRLWGGT